MKLTDLFHDGEYVKKMQEELHHSMFIPRAAITPDQVFSYPIVEMQMSAHQKALEAKVAEAKSAIEIVVIKNLNKATDRFIHDPKYPDVAQMVEDINRVEKTPAQREHEMFSAFKLNLARRMKAEQERMLAHSIRAQRYFNGR